MHRSARSFARVVGRRPALLAWAALLLTSLGGAACSRGSEEAPSGESGTPSAAPAGDPAAGEQASEPAGTGPLAVGCALSTGEVGIQSLQLRSEDGDCRLYLPPDPVVGEYTVQVSAVGRDDAAALEAATTEGRLYATSGRVTVTVVEGNRIAGTIEASDEVAPVRGSVSASFDVTLP